MQVRSTPAPPVLLPPGLLQLGPLQSAASSWPASHSSPQPAPPARMDADMPSASRVAPPSPSCPDAPAGSSAAASRPLGSCSPLQTASPAASPAAACRSRKNSASPAPSAHRAPPSSTPAPARQTMTAASHLNGSCSRSSAGLPLPLAAPQSPRSPADGRSGSIQLRCEKQQQSNRDNGTDESAHDRLISFDSDRSSKSHFEGPLVSEEMNN